MKEKIDFFFRINVTELSSIHEFIIGIEWTVDKNLDGITKNKQELQDLYLDRKKNK